jgi:hypothetical protein
MKLHCCLLRRLLITNNKIFKKKKQKLKIKTLRFFVGIDQKVTQNKALEKTIRTSNLLLYFTTPKLYLSSKSIFFI